ncbi:MAG TPA: hydrogenase maturation protease [Caldithrix sp.]|nr:hydrogenase maturation protease [Calditrichaceae bacterium]HEM49571.1 hydrogenase maturation protease [Caldithrix sp.]
MLKVISLGNELRGDDSVGLVVLNELRSMELPAPLMLIDAGSDAFIVLEHLMASDPILLIDCARMGRQPGEVIKFKVNDSNIKSFEKSISLHGFSFAEVFKMARQFGSVPDCSIVGIEPKSIEFGQKLSDEVKQNLPSIIKMVIEEAKQYGN